MPQGLKKTKTAAASHARQHGNGVDAAKVATLKDLRKATRHTQEDLAIALGVGQGTISRIEKRDDMLVSTLQHYEPPRVPWRLVGLS